MRLPTVQEAEDQYQQLEMLVTFQAVVWQCYKLGEWSVVFNNSGKVFFQCLYDFTRDVEWYIPVSREQTFYE
eukprot:CAMPEP_0168627252 /NCGR_PEP_ID=MMETSP0449_2-20121227/11127_1 /TAXON_ID=1082188 /ORGANISM="Strombidium rassoulzadegani, Strain ras09" /LENGTH=71 /DNA_ID=CAMNT_0008669423 /DNA_START=134 /DNA_END=349 /DNA_ORIENTATION=+